MGRYPPSPVPETPERKPRNSLVKKNVDAERKGWGFWTSVLSRDFSKKKIKEKEFLYLISYTYFV